MLVSSQYLRAKRSKSDKSALSSSFRIKAKFSLNFIAFWLANFWTTKDIGPKD